MRLCLLGIFTWFPQVLHPAHTWDWSAARAAGTGWQYGAGGCGGSMVEVSEAGAARLRFQGGGRRAGWVSDTNFDWREDSGLGASRMGGTRELVNSRVISNGKLRERLGGLVT